MKTKSENQTLRIGLYLMFPSVFDLIEFALDFFVCVEFSRKDIITKQFNSNFFKGKFAIKLTDT